MATINYPCSVHIDRARNLGVKLDIAEIAAAEVHIRRAEELETLAASVWAREFNADALAAGFDDGTVTLTDLYAACSMLTSPDAKTRVHGVLTTVQQSAETKAIAGLRDIGERWITDLVRPAANAIIERVATAAPNVGPGWTDSTIQHCDDPAIVAAFNAANDAANDLLELRNFVAGLTGTGNNPRVLTATIAEARRPDRFQPIPGVFTYSLLESVRRDAEPGIWLASEVVRSRSKSKSAA